MAEKLDKEEEDEHWRKNICISQNPAPFQLSNTFTIAHPFHRFALISVNEQDAMTFATFSYQFDSRKIVENIRAQFPEAIHSVLYVVPTNKLLVLKDFGNAQLN